MFAHFNWNMRTWTLHCKSSIFFFDWNECDKFTFVSFACVLLRSLDGSYRNEFKFNNRNESITDANTHVTDSCMWIYTYYRETGFVKQPRIKFHHTENDECERVVGNKAIGCGWINKTINKYILFRLWVAFSFVSSILERDNSTKINNKLVGRYGDMYNSYCLLLLQLIAIRNNPSRSVNSSCCVFISLVCITFRPASRASQRSPFSLISLPQFIRISAAGKW